MATPSAPFVGDVVWTTSVEPGSNAPASPVDRFPADAPVIQAAVPVANLPGGSVLSAQWTYNDVPLDGLNAEVGISAPVADRVWVEFHLDRTDDLPWPSGTYAISITLNGQVVRSSRVDVLPGETT